MRNTKIYSILKEFDKYEQNRCRKFLQSPYFNKDQVILKLFDLILCEINTGKEQYMDNATLWKSLQLPSIYDDVRLRKYFSDLTKLVEDYLCQQLYEENALQRASYLIQAAKKKKIEKLYKSSVKNARLVLQNIAIQSVDFFYYQYLIEQNYFELSEFDTKRDQRSNLEDISNNLDSFYLAEKLKLLCTAINTQKFVSAQQYEIKLKNKLVEYIKDNIDFYQNTPLVLLYYHVYLTLSEPEQEDHYFILKSLLEKYAQQFPTKVAVNDFYNAALNYCIIKLNQGDQKFVKEVVDLYKDMIKKNILVVDGEVSPWLFRNAVVLGLRLGENEWVEDFIKTHQEFLPESMRENAVAFNLAQVYFYQKRYEKVIELLQAVEFEDLTYNLNSKTFLLMTYYEINETEPLYSLFESFRTYLNRRKDIPQARRQNFLKLIQFTRKLTKILPGDQKSVEKLKTEIAAAKSAASYNWLMEKVAELE